MDSDPLSQYQMQHNQHLEEKAAKAEEKKREAMNNANTYIEEFFKKRALAKERKSTENRNEEDKFVSDRDAALEGKSTNKWASVASYVDFKVVPLGKDTTRMKKVLLDLKN